MVNRNVVGFVNISDVLEHMGYTEEEQEEILDAGFSNVTWGVQIHIARVKAMQGEVVANQRVHGITPGDIAESSIQYLILLLLGVSHMREHIHEVHETHHVSIHH